MVRALVGRLEQEGIPREVILRATGLRPELLAIGTSELPVEAYVRFVRAAAALSSEPALGLRAGACSPAEAGSLLSLVLLAAPTLRHAFELGRRYAPIYVEDARWSLDEEGEEASVGYVHDGLPADVERIEAEIVMSFTLVRVAGHFLGTTARPLRVCFRHAEPAWATVYADVFRCPVEFESATNQIVVNRAVLDIRQTHADETLLASLQVHVEGLLEERLSDDRLVHHVKSELRQQLADGSHDIAFIARKLGLSVRTLRRRLRSRGTSARDLVEQVRRSAAEAALLGSGRSLAAVAEEVGYSEPSAFYRAFKRWTGLTPQQFRDRASEPERS